MGNASNFLQGICQFFDVGSTPKGPKHCVYFRELVFENRGFVVMDFTLFLVFGRTFPPKAVYRLQKSLSFVATKLIGR